MIRNRRARTRHSGTAKFVVDPKRLNGSKIHFTFDDVVTESACIPRGMDKHLLANECYNLQRNVIKAETGWFLKSILTEIQEGKDEKEN